MGADTARQPPAGAEAGLRRRRALWPALLAALAAAAAVHYFLLPASGVDSLPPECYAYLGYVVPCGSGWWMGGAAAAAVLVGALVNGITPRRTRAS